MSWVQCLISNIQARQINKINYSPSSSSLTNVYRAWLPAKVNLQNGMVLCYCYSSPFFPFDSSGGDEDCVEGSMAVLSSMG
jgi:hypothetical protein